MNHIIHIIIRHLDKNMGYFIGRSHPGMYCRITTGEIVQNVIGRIYENYYMDIIRLHIKYSRENDKSYE